MKSTQLESVDPKREIEKLAVKVDCSLIELIEETHKRKFRPGCAFFEFTHQQEDISEDKEIIIMSTKVYCFMVGYAFLLKKCTCYSRYLAQYSHAVV